MASGFSKFIFWFLIIGNIIGAIFGFTYWYGPQLLASPFQYWIFIATCPLYAALFVVCALFIWYKKKNSFLFYLTSVGLVKYGLWTVAFWANYKGAPVNNWMFLWLIFSHSMMVLESVILYSRIEFKKWHVAIAWAWFGLNDYVHYSMQYAAAPFKIIPTEMYVAIILTVLGPLAVYWLVKLFRYNNLKILI